MKRRKTIKFKKPFKIMRRKSSLLRAKKMLNKRPGFNYTDEEEIDFD